MTGRRGQPQGQDLFQAFFRTLSDAFGMQYPSRSHITHEIHRFIAINWLNTLNREEYPSFFLYLLFPYFIIHHFLSCTHQDGIGFKQKQDFSL